MTALEAALTILWQGMLGIFAVMGALTSVSLPFSKSGEERGKRPQPARAGGVGFT